jgi:uncharacterized protein YciI
MIGCLFSRQSWRIQKFSREKSMWKRAAVIFCGLLFCSGNPAFAEGEAPAPQYDAGLAKSLGADEMGMHNYVLVILKTGPKPVPAEARAEVFKGHMANIRRLAAEKKLVMAGPLDGVDGLRGLFVFNAADIDEAKKLVATDPVIISGEMVAEFHKFYGSAGLMMLNEIHSKIQKKSF